MADIVGSTVNSLMTGLRGALAGSFQTLSTTLIQSTPQIIAAIILVAIGYGVAWIVARVLKRVLQFIGLEEFLAQHRLEDALGGVQVSRLLVQITKYYILLVFLQAAVSQLNLSALTNFLTAVLDFAVVLIGAGLIIAATALVGELIKERILDVSRKSKLLVTVATAAKYLTIFIGVVVGLDTIGYGTTIITETFVSIVNSVILGIALAVGIAFGLGGQSDAKDMLKKARKKLSI